MATKKTAASQGAYLFFTDGMEYSSSDHYNTMADALDAANAWIEDGSINTGEEVVIAQVVNRFKVKNSLVAI